MSDEQDNSTWQDWKPKPDHRWNGSRAEWQRENKERNERPRGGYDCTDVHEVWIGGLPHDITEREVERVCSKFGPIELITIKQNATDTFVFIFFSRTADAKMAIETLDQSNLFGSGVVKCAPASKRPEKGGPKGGGKGPKGCKGTGKDTYFRRRSPSPKRARSRSAGRDRHRAKEHEDRDRDREDTDQKRVRGKSKSPPPKPRRARVHLSQLPRDMDEDELQEIANDFGKVLKYELHQERSYKFGWVEYASKKEALRAVNDLDDRRVDDWSMRIQAYMYPGGE